MLSSDQSVDFFSKLIEITQVSDNLSYLENRRLFPTLATVLDNNDPENRRRVIVADPLFSGTVKSAFINPIQFTKSVDPPLPDIGQLVIIWFVNGDQEQGYYMPVLNDPNPSQSKKNSVDDHSQVISGDSTVVIGRNDDQTIRNDQQITVNGDRTIAVSASDSLGVAGDLEIRSEQNLVVNAGQSITFTTDSGAFLNLSAAGYVTIQDAFGRKITLGGVGGIGQWNLNGYPLEMINATSFKINGHEVATVGAVDTRGDTITGKGW